jgi:hypothetical protein
MNNQGSAYLKTHRMEERRGKERKTEYSSSELQAVEVLELLCQDIKKAAKFIVHPRQNIRLMIAGQAKEARDAEPAFPYDSKEEAKLSNIESRAADFCEAVLDDYEHVLVAAIQRHRTLDKLTEGMCRYGLKVCDKDLLEKASRDEHNRYEKYQKRAAKTGKKKPSNPDEL